jgi:hypothetical protein
MHLLLGYVRVHQHRLADAQASFEAAVDVEPANVSAQLVLGSTMLAQGNAEGGRAAIEQAVRLAPGLAPLRDVALERAGRGDVAGLERLIDVTRRTLGAMQPVESVIDSVRAGRG